MEGSDSFLVLGSPVISPKAPRRTLGPVTSVDIKKGESASAFRTWNWSRKPESQRRRKRPEVTSSKANTGGSPIRKGRSFIADRARGRKSPFPSQHWSEVS